MVATPLAAQEVVFHYTSTASKNCKVLDGARKDGDWIVLGCPGLAGNMVLISEDDLRTTVSIGKNRAAAAMEPAAKQGFPSFNSTYDTMEWRSAKGGPPFATIQRWRLNDPENLAKTGRPEPFGLMVVTRLGVGAVCHVAYVDVRANKDANVLARQAADQHARTFDCKNPPLIIGQRGRAIELAGR
jgi:hypothetical protein